MLQWRRPAAACPATWTAAFSVFGLTASGSIRIAGTDIPLHGYYRSAGYVVGGTALAAPDFSLSGDLADALGGGIGLHGGAALVGGTIGFGTPVADDPSMPQRAARSSATSSTALVPVTPTGTSSLQLTSSDPFRLPVTFSYTDQDNWSITGGGDDPGQHVHAVHRPQHPRDRLQRLDRLGERRRDVGCLHQRAHLDRHVHGRHHDHHVLGDPTLYCRSGPECPDNTGIFFYSKGTIFADPSLPAVTAGGSFIAEQVVAGSDVDVDAVHLQRHHHLQPGAVESGRAGVMTLPTRQRQRRRHHRCRTCRATTATA